MLYIVYSMNYQSVAILGRQPHIGLAELESLLGPDSLLPVGQNTVKLSRSVDNINFARLGGTVKLAHVLATVKSTHWSDIESFLTANSPAHAQEMPEGKLTIGLSVYGLNADARRINATALGLKKSIRGTGKSVRIIPNKEIELSSAQVIHNGLTGPRGWELLIIRDGQTTLIAQTTHIQDIESYAARDQARPARDARVGMLPPKLAQTIVNLATGNTSDDDTQTVLDPFCGTGVVLQEALLMGYGVMGSDLEPRMVDYSVRNLQWLVSEFANYMPKHLPKLDFNRLVQPGDATNHQWLLSPDFIACETYLGQPFSAEPKPERLSKVMQDVDTIHRKFLQNIAKQTKPGFRMCLAMPAWFVQGKVKHLNVLDSLNDLGYNRIEFVHANVDDLIYHREGQIVGRELVVLVRK